MGYSKDNPVITMVNSQGIPWGWKTSADYCDELVEGTTNEKDEPRYTVDARSL